MGFPSAVLPRFQNHHLRVRLALRCIDQEQCLQPLWMDHWRHVVCSEWNVFMDCGWQTHSHWVLEYADAHWAVHIRDWIAAGDTLRLAEILLPFAWENLDCGRSVEHLSPSQLSRRSAGVVWNRHRISRVAQEPIRVLPFSSVFVHGIAPVECILSLLHIPDVARKKGKCDVWR